MSGEFDTILLLETNLDRQTDAIRAADTKINFLVPTCTAMLGFVAGSFARSDIAGPMKMVALLCAAPLIVVYILLAVTAIPRVFSGSRSNVFFGGIAARDIGEYSKDMAVLDREGYQQDLVEQCHVTARIAGQKNLHARNAYLGFVAALPFWTAAVYLLNRHY